jgi:hypothetical protein
MRVIGSSIREANFHLPQLLPATASAVSSPYAPEVLLSEDARHLNGHASSKRSSSLGITTTTIITLLLLLLFGCLHCC